VGYNELAQVDAVRYLFCCNSGRTEQTCICVFIFAITIHHPQNFNKLITSISLFTCHSVTHICSLHSNSAVPIALLTIQIHKITSVLLLYKVLALSRCNVNTQNLIIFHVTGRQIKWIRDTPGRLMVCFSCYVASHAACTYVHTHRLHSTTHTPRHNTTAYTERKISYNYHSPTHPHIQFTPQN